MSPTYRRAIPLFALAIAVAIALTVLGGAAAWLVLVVDGALAAGVLAAAVGWGAWPAVWLGLGRRPVLQQVCIAAALGLGVLSTLSLGLGVTGALNGPVAWVLLALGWALGMWRAARLHGQPLAGERHDPVLAASIAPLLIVAVLLLALVVPLAIACFGATLPPGVLWAGENRAYDALEYHLEAPREYYDAGRIHFLPHNVYASFPQQMEMLYLLLMHLAGGSLTGAIPAQLLHALCGVMAVLALAAWTPRGPGRVVVAVLAGSTPWLAYLGCLAYVELAMLFFAAVAAGLVLDQVKGEWPCNWRTALAAGLCAGLAGGTKYTALAFVAAGLGLAWLCTMRAALPIRARRLAVYAGGMLVAFSPWLVRNAAFTGNPVYPFGYRWLGGAAWSAEQDQQWARGHRVPAGSDSVAGRSLAVWHELFAARMFGPALFLLALCGLVRAHDRATVFWTVWLAVIIAAWATLTHMPGRFAVPSIIPLALLAGRAVPSSVTWRDLVQRGPAVRTAACRLATLMLLAVLAGGVANSATLNGLRREEDRWWGRHGVPLRALVGRTDLLTQVQPLNRALPADANAWLVGEARAFYLTPRVHYTVVFNRDPWLTYAARAAPAQAVAWLRTQSVTHVVFSWSEIERLQRSYGFPAFVTQDWVWRLGAAGLRRIALPDELDATDLDIYAVAPG